MIMFKNNETAEIGRNKMLKKHIKNTVAIIAAATSFASIASAEINGPVNYIIPFGPGGESDISSLQKATS